MKRFNYTGRKKVLKEDVKVRLQGDFHEKPIVDLIIDFSDYDFSPEARVFLEPQWKTRFMRIPVGYAKDTVRANRIVLEEFDDAEDLDFRVKVVDEQRGLLLGSAENIKPYNKDNELDRNQQSILPVSSADLSECGSLWRIMYQDQNATLQVERELGNKEQVVRSLLFKGFILPAAMRQILARIISEEWDEALSEPEDLSTRWLLFAKQLGAGLPERNGEDNEYWLESTVRLLTSRIGVRREIIDNFESGVWK